MPDRGRAGRCAIIRGSSLLTALVIGELLWGFGMIAFETLLPPRMAEVSGGVEEAARLLGPAITAAWVLSALGAAARRGWCAGTAPASPAASCASSTARRWWGWVWPPARPA